MSAVENTDTDIEGGGRRRQRRRRPSVACSSETTNPDCSLCFSDANNQSPLDSTACGSYDECRFSQIEGIPHPHRDRESSSVSESLSDEVDLESGDLEAKAYDSGLEERDCRICHLNLVGGGGGDIELGCACKGDLGAAHKQCAETWFKIKGNTTCEICGATALNVAGEQTNEANNAAAAATAAPVVLSETQNLWQGRRILNFLLACMVFAFVISWLFHFKVFP